MADREGIEKALHTEQWQSLYEPSTSRNLPVSSTTSTGKNQSATLTSDNLALLSELTSGAKALAYDVCIYLDSQFKERQQRLNFSARQIENAKAELEKKGMVRPVWLGKSLMLAPTSKLYTIMGLESPYKRNVSDIHSFLVLLAAKLIEPNPLVKYVKPEASLGDSSSTVDLLACMYNGQYWAYEITLSPCNVLANASKLQHKGISQIIFVCRDFKLKQAVWASIRDAGFAPDFLSTIRCTIFSILIRQRKQMRFREIK